MPKPRAKPKRKPGAPPATASNRPAPKTHKRLAAPRRAVQRRPTEIGTGVVGAVVALIANAFEITDPTVLTALIVVVGFIPAAITWLVHTIKEK